MNAKDLQGLTELQPNTSKTNDVTPPRATPTTKKNRPPTRKELAFVKHLVDNPKSTATEAYQAAYNTKTTNKPTLHTEAHKTLSKPSVISELAKYNNLVENTIINTINDWGDEDNTRKREIAINSAMYVHDKIHGKSTQKIQQSTEVVSININLTGDNEQPPIDL